jgi:hypothetical protein
MEFSLATTNARRCLILAGLLLLGAQSCPPRAAHVAAATVWCATRVDSDFPLRLEAGQGALLLLAARYRLEGEHLELLDAPGALGHGGLSVHHLADGRITAELAPGYALTLAPDATDLGLACVSVDGRSFARVAQPSGCSGTTFELDRVPR